MGDYDDGRCALLSIHEFLLSTGNGDESSSAPLETLIDSFRAVVLAPEPFAPALAQLREAFASLLFTSHSPPDLCQWLAASDLIASKEVTSGRRQVDAISNAVFLKLFSSFFFLCLRFDSLLT